MNVVTVDGKTIDLNSREGYAVLCNLWTRSGWVQKYSYGFSWLAVRSSRCPKT
jgi:hypothetical protein